MANLMQADSEVEEVRPGFDVDVGETDEQRNLPESWYVLVSYV